MVRHNLCAAAVALAIVAFAGKSEATTITFDGAVNGVVTDDPGDPFDNCVGYCAYAGTAGNDGVFTTQGFTFTALPNGSGSGDESEAIVVDPTVAPSLPDNGTDWLLAGGIVQMTRADNGTFSLFNFQAANVDPTDPTVGQIIRVVAVKSGGFFELLTFDLNAAPGFQTFSLPGTWTDLTSVRFSGRFNVNDGSPRVTAVDNIDVGVTAVPEPASFLLLGTGALSLLARARRRKAARTL